MRYARSADLNTCKAKKSNRYYTVTGDELQELSLELHTTNLEMKWSLSLSLIKSEAKKAVLVSKCHQNFWTSSFNVTHTIHMFKKSDSTLPDAYM